MGVDTTKGLLIRRRVLSSTLSNYVGKVVTLGMGFVLTPFILHQIGPTAYGLWILVGSMVAYTSLLDLGIAGAIIKYVAEYRARGELEQARRLVATALWLYSGLGLIAIALSAVIAPFFPRLFNIAPEQHAVTVWLVILSGISVGISIPCSTTGAVLRGLQRFELSNLLGIIGTLLSALIIVAVLLLGGGLLGMVAAGIVLMLVMQVPSIWVIHRAAPDLRFGWRGASLKLARTVATFSSSVFVINAAGQLETETDELVIGAFLSVNAVTPYAIARRLSEVPRMLTDQFMKILLPLASELHAEEDYARLRLLYVTSTRLAIAIFLALGCTIAMLTRPLLAAWVGREYASYADLVWILTLASLIDTSTWPAAFVLQGMGRHRPLAVAAVCTGLANFALSVTLVRQFGQHGVAFGTLIPTAVVCLGFVLPYALRVVGVSARQSFREIIWPGLAPVAPMLITLYVLLKAFEPTSLFSIAAIAGVAVLTYVVAYFAIAAGAVERQLYQDFALKMLYLARTWLTRLRGLRELSREENHE